MDTTAQQQATMTCLDDIASWVGLSDILRAELYTALGAEGKTRCRFIAIMKPNEYSDAVPIIKPTAAPPTPVQKSQIAMVGRVAQILDGFILTDAAQSEIQKKGC